MVTQLQKPDYETKTLAIANGLLMATREKKNFLAQMRDQMRWDDKIMDFAMDNPGLKVQLFRFIDALPALRSKPEIARHLQEYLSADAVELPGALKSLLNFTNPDSMPGQLAATTVAPAVETLAYRYISGENMDKAIKAIERMRKDKLTFTMDLLGEAVITEAEAEAYLYRYLDLMAQLSAAAKNWKTVDAIDRAGDHPLSKVQVSVKLTAFYSQFDPLDAEGSRQAVSQHIRTLLRRSAELGVMVHFDMEQYEYKDLTLAILKDLLLEPEFRDRDDLGVTMQAYLRDSYEDLEGLVAWAKQRGTPVTVRLVKGAYWDQETILARQNNWPTPVYSQKVSTDANFEQMTRLLLENHQYLYAAIGSHNVRSQAYAMAIAEELKIPKRNIELQVLYGMADKLAKILADKGYRVRVYTPFGELIPGMSYLIRRLLENTANSSFLRQNLEDASVEDLLAAPQFAPEDQAVEAGEPEDWGEWAPPFENSADTDYAIAAERDAATEAMETVRQQLGQRYRPIINGEAVNTDTSLDSVNPSNPSQLIGKVGLTSQAQADAAIAGAKAAWADWAATPPAERAAILRRAADLMESRRAELNAWIVLEVGKPLGQADPEVSEAIDFCRFYADEMERLDAGYAYDYPGETNRYRYFPRGLTVVISPWNFPFAITTGMTVASLVAGNCTLLKPAENSSVIAAKIVEILYEAGIPAGALQFLPAIGATVGAHLVQHPDIHMIAFTGSRAVGCEIYAKAAQWQPGQKHLKRVVAEMGGKNGIIVDESADLDQAVQGVVYSAFGFSGQKCSACSRVIVVEAIYETFLNRLIEATRSLHVGDAAAASTKVGPVIDAKAQEKILSYIETGKQEATLALSLSAPEQGYFIPPTVFTDVAPDAVIAQEEIFGPVLAVIKAPDFDTALAIANNTDYGLTGGLYSRTPSHIDRVQTDFVVGNLYINRSITGAIVSRHPFGGLKMSGVGSKAGGPDYLLQFLEPRHVSENVQRQGFAPIAGVDD
ncbi:L-glutamate gamma-semialdehyde dehydrogenase [Halomicronema sp. CCY15110]|uniref:L-glutamate gamma-semialdehyde dehydrogenase n=1 Tax=Halomicronema sp. CCY15110 TaxID=2767773 RepID=UPI00194DC7AE|nr:L-glutamate gamma-semialdehyde dehydrogenase [Halomicronema sp. CCY15110]